jgi:predicted hydrolase (HD superfamily)
MGKTYRKEKDQHSKHTARRSLEIDREHRRDDSEKKHLINEVMHHYDWSEDEENDDRD